MNQDPPDVDMEESKKRQHEDKTPTSQRRQPRSKKEEDVEEAIPRKELFPTEARSSYVTFYSKEHRKGKEPRWKQQMASIEERTMQAATPHTAKKHAPNPAAAEEVSKQLEHQITQAKHTMDRMQQSMANTEQPPYIQETQQQTIALQQSVQELEKQAKDIRHNIQDVDILTQHVHDTLLTQQKREAAKQTVAKGWPKDFTDAEREDVISWYAEKAGVASQLTTTHGRYMYGRYKPSPITIMHSEKEMAKHTFEKYIYKRYNKHTPITIWDKNNKTVYFGSQPHRINFAPQTSDMERDINLTIQAALHIVTTHPESDLAHSWNKVAVKWHDKLAIRVADNAVIFKLIRDKEDSKYMYLHIHQQYFDIINDGWSKGWSEANSKTKYPEYSQYAYMLKFAVLRGNEEYYTMRDARWGEPSGTDSRQHDN